MLRPSSNSVFGKKAEGRSTRTRKPYGIWRVDQPTVFAVLAGNSPDRPSLRAPPEPETGETRKIGGPGQ
jgi:hypothetical protein